MSSSNRYIAWLTSGYNPYLFIGIAVLISVLLFIPFETTVVPAWRLRVVDLNGNSCSRMRVVATWQHYSLELEPTSRRDTRITDSAGYVEFPRRSIAARLGRRIVNTSVAYLKFFAHGSVGPSGSVWASGIKDVAWLSYEPGKPLPATMIVEKCLAENGT